MSRDVAVRCRCGQVRGRLRDVSPVKVNRVVCYCGDCQAFAHWLERADVLDAHGGTDIVQFAPSSLAFEGGDDRIVGMRLSSNGLHRWYATCCKTPLGNTVSAAVPFIGLPLRTLPDVTDPDEQDALFGRAFPVLGKSALGAAPAGSLRPSLRMIARLARLLLGWKLGGKAWPHPFYDRTTGNPRHGLVTLPPSEREALRRFCGPRPALAT